MALSRQKKEATVQDVEQLLADSKMTVFVHYAGTPVKALQELRLQARENGTQLRVVKNRLFKKALESNSSLKNVGTDSIQGQLLYAFNRTDEVAPAQSLAAFARANPQIKFVGAITDEGQLLSADDVKALASLPTKDQLRAQLVATIGSPVSGFVAVMAGNVRGVLNVLNARVDNLSN
ncbi:MAG TPA: 50S ribosomal protein L10 [Candidatus Saccharimonadales bacterium]|nr:50S ribosomal protein L10 [Candidatus Saccharimonadales bacterium]